MMRQRQWIAVARRTSHVNTKLRRPCFASAAQRLSNESVISKQRHKILTLRKRILNVLGHQAWLITVVDFNPWNWRCAWRHAWHFFKIFLPFPAAQELARKFNQSAVRLFAIQSPSSTWKRRKHGGRSPIQSWICQVKSFFLQALQG